MLQIQSLLIEKTPLLYHKHKAISNVNGYASLYWESNGTKNDCGYTIRYNTSYFHVRNVAHARTHRCALQGHTNKPKYCYSGLLAARKKRDNMKIEDVVAACHRNGIPRVFISLNAATNSSCGHRQAHNSLVQYGAALRAAGKGTVHLGVRTAAIRNILHSVSR
jgi:hypothetical protein